MKLQLFKIKYNRTQLLYIQLYNILQQFNYLNYRKKLKKN